MIIHKDWYNWSLVYLSSNSRNPSQWKQPGHCLENIQWTSTGQWYKDLITTIVTKGHRWMMVYPYNVLTIVLCLILLWLYFLSLWNHVNRIHSPMSFMTTSSARGQLFHFPSASETTINDMGETTVTKNIQYNKVRTAAYLFGCAAQVMKSHFRFNLIDALTNQ